MSIQHACNLRLVEEINEGELAEPGDSEGTLLITETTSIDWIEYAVLCTQINLILVHFHKTKKAL